MSEVSESSAPGEVERIAIIGLGGRFPGASDLAGFWENLQRGDAARRSLTDEEMERAGVPRALHARPDWVRAAYVLDGATHFDAGYFGYSPREAELMDPQQRLFLECAVEALEHAGWDAERFPGAISVFASASLSSYLLRALAQQPDLQESAGAHALMVGNDKDFIAMRVSHRLNLRGPSLTVQTACSSSLVAVHLACQSLLSNECDVALAGGASVSFPQMAGYQFQEGMIYSPDGYCRAFDAQARGTARGAGAAIVVLKRLSDALRDRDTVHAVLLGSAVNNDGAAKVGFTAPSVEGQTAVIAEALAIAGVAAGDLQYVEAHGTGTSLGDPIEVSALNQAFGGKALGPKRCALGSLKANIGHLDAAAGSASLLKAVLALENRVIPPTANFQTPNPRIDFASGPFYVPTAAQPWATGGAKRRAGVSALGIGGTNAHVVLEEAPPARPSTTRRDWHALALSARSPAALEQATTRLAQHLDRHPDAQLADVAFTLQVGRRVHEHRRVLLCRDTADARAALREPARALTLSGASARRPVVFLLQGQGAQHARMGQALYEADPVFRKHLDACAEGLKPHLGSDLRAALYPPAGDARAEEASLSRGQLAHAALFSFEYALAQRWRSLGVEPEAMIGHSQGEYVAACLAGVFSLEDALRLTAVRGRLQETLAPGGMLSIPLSEAELAPLLPPGVTIACVNAPSLVVVSGAEELLAPLEGMLAARGVESHRLHVPRAMHSPAVEPVLEELTRELSRVRFSPPAIPYLSNLTGTWVTAEQAMDPRAWAQHMRQPVRFADGAALLLANPEYAFLEVGAGNPLGTMLRRCAPPGSPLTVLASAPGPREAQAQDSARHFTETAARLWLSGARVELGKLYAGEQRRRVPLPTYPFQREQYDLLSKAPAPRAPAAPSSNPTSTALERMVAGWRRAAAAPARDLKGQRWLVLEPDAPFAARVSERLRAAGAEVATLAAGSAVREQVEALRAGGFTPEHVAYLWPLSASAALTAEAIEARQPLALHGLLELARVLGPAAEAGAAPVSISVVTCGAQDVTGEESLDPSQATCAGAFRVLPQEYVGLRARAIDVTWPADDGAHALFAERLVAELAAEDAPIVALRGPYRFVEAFEPAPEPTAPPLPLEDGGVYLIAGGLGRVGLAIAEQLAAAARPKLVLLSRHGLPAPGEWDAWLGGHSPEEATSRGIQHVRALERLGAQVLALRADVGDAGQLEHALRAAEARFGPVNGVFYAAGDGSVAARLPVAEATPEACAPLLRGRLLGLATLAQVLATRRPAFVAVHSSLVAVLGGVGCSAIAAAHAGMDAFVARQSRAPGPRWSAISWDVWGVGAGFRPEAVIPPAEGFRLWRDALAAPAGGRLLVVKGSLAARLRPQTALSAGTASSPGGRHPRPPLANPYLAPRDETEQRVAVIFEELLGIDRIGVTDNFFELGGHSLLGVQVLSRMREAFKVELSLRALFDSPTVELMAVAIVQARAGDVDAATLEALMAELEGQC